ncbi:MAG: ParB N-terminal domain-containing protein [Bryobacteraceae bacterium]|jgi:ParB-like chromosome segregation protein Spo0J
MKLPISSIRREFQPAEYMLEERIMEIVAALERGEILPSVTVRYDGQNYWLQDGFHRVAAMEAVGREEIEAEVIPGGLADIQAEFDRMAADMRGKW